MNTTDSFKTKITCPSALTALSCIICLYVLLSKVLCFEASVAICLFLTILFGSIVFINDSIKHALILVVCTALCFFHALLSYFTLEKQAIDFINEKQNEPPGTYEVKITSCKNYSSFSTAYGIILSCDSKRNTTEFNCRITCYSSQGLSAGAIIYFTSVPEHPSNDSGSTFDNVSYLRSRKCFITFSNITIDKAKNSKITLHEKTQNYIENVIYSNIPSQDSFESADISYSMLVGDKQFLDSSLKDSFTKSGIIHLLCVSGMHLSVMTAAFYGFLNMCGAGKRLSAMLLIAFCVFYLWIIGFPISATRAGIICILSCCASILGRNTDPFASLFSCAVIVCIISPYSILDISAQLSFISCLGIVTAQDLFTKRQSALKPPYLKFFDYIKFLIIINSSASLFTCLLAAHSFGGISITSVPATILTSFICEILLTSLIILIIISPLAFIQPVILFIGFICRICADSICIISRFFSNLRYSYIQTSQTFLPLILFIILLIILILFIYSDKKKYMLVTYFCCVLVCILVIFHSLTLSMIDDSVYKISYFRQNKDDRQLSIKLERQGYLIVNADNSLCLNTAHANFDSQNGKNYILIIPDKLIDARILASNIQIFHKKFGIEKIFLPDTPDGIALKNELLLYDRTSHFIDNIVTFGNTTIIFDFSHNSTFFTVDDGKTRTSILFSDNYSNEKFTRHSDIAAYFTRETKNQFDIDTCAMPNCDTFVTRLKKDQTAPNIQNTYGEKSFYIKE